VRSWLGALNVSLCEPMIPLARKRPRVLRRQQSPFAFFLSSDVCDAAFDCRKPLTVQRARLNDGRTWGDIQPRFPSDTVEAFIAGLSVFGDAFAGSEAAAFGWSKLGRYTRHV
jgi:hypothetical protein